MLETFLINQGIIKPQRIHLLCVPDYLFFRTHAHRIYREFKGIPRYSIISRKVTDQLELEQESDHTCSLETLYIVDGSTALRNAPFYFPLAKQLDLSIVGTNLDITELPKLRYTTISNKSYQKYDPITIVSSEVHYHAPLNESGMESKTVTLPPSFNLFPQPITISKNTIAIGSVRAINDFFPTNFDLMRVNLGDLIEYNQRFSKTLGNTDNMKANRKQRILDGMNTIIRSFNISVVLVSLYKIAKFFNISPDPIKDQIHDICDHWNFSEFMIINNEKRRVWEKESLGKLDELFDAIGYIAFFNRSDQEKITKPLFSQDIDESFNYDDITESQE